MMGAKRNANLRAAIQEGMDSGPAMTADELFVELNARYVGDPPHSTHKRAFKARNNRRGRAKTPFGNPKECEDYLSDRQFRSIYPQECKDNF